jgi:hypothetical protein
LFVSAGLSIRAMPRIVPAHAKLRSTNRSQIMTHVYGYLQKKGILPLREVPFTSDLETTLRKHDVLVAPDAYPESWNPLVCEWNSRLCVNGLLKSIQNDTTVRIPDLQLTKFVETTLVELDRRTLGQEADSRVTSPEFAIWRSEDKLKAMNEPELMMAKEIQARTVNRGKYLVPIEHVQYLIPAVAADLSPRGELKELEARIHGLSVVSLEEGLHQAATAYSRAQDPVPLSELGPQFRQLHKRVHYISTAADRVPARVGIAEKRPPDLTHPDLAGAFIGGLKEIPPGSWTPDVRKERPNFEDHATMVAWIIGARRSRFGFTGLAPRAQLTALDGSEGRIATAIGDAAIEGVRLFNVSAHFGRSHEPQALFEVIRDNPRALFVVAAGNEAQTICEEAYKVYPACWGHLQNVMVVTATSGVAETILDGMNRSGLSVHVAAPGQGFHSGGVSRSYVPVNGTSFATPIVTAAAALLFGSGITEPWAIKQRLIATADPLPGSADVQGGTLNIAGALRGVERAGYALLARDDAANPGQDETKYVELVQNPLMTFVVRGSRQAIPLQDLLRVHQVADGRVRVVYLDRNLQRPEKTTIEVLTSATFFGEQGDAFRALGVDGKAEPIHLAEWREFFAPVQ